MPRRAPPPDLTPTRTSISLPKKIFVAGAKVVDPAVPAVEDFSAVLTAALTEYLERHHPGLIEETAKMLRGLIYAQAPAKDLKAAEKQQARPSEVTRLADEFLHPKPRKPRGPTPAPRK